MPAQLSFTGLGIIISDPAVIGSPSLDLCSVRSEQEIISAELYETLEEACRELGYHEAYVSWVIAGYEGHMADYDIDEAIATAEKNYGFHFDFDEAAYRKENELEPEDEIDDWEIEEVRNEAFYDWVDKYRKPLDEDADADFLDNVFNLCPEVDTYDYEVVIPDAIIEMAKKELEG